MSLWMLLTLAILGIFLFQIGSYFAIQKEHSIPEDPFYAFWVLIAIMGAFLSATAFTKIAREIDESKLK